MIVEADPVRAGTDRDNPIFCLTRMSTAPYCITSCNQEQRAKFASKLRLLSQQTWVQLKMASKRGTGSEIIPTSAIKGATVPRDVTEDTELIVFRFGKDGRMVGFRQDATYHILWCDCSYKLYDHGS